VLSLANTDALFALSALTRANVAVYPVDPCGLQIAFAEPVNTPAGSPRPSGVPPINARLGAQADLQALAEVTGGFAVTNTNNFAAAFERIVRESSSYYTLGFESGHEKTDGRFVPVTVRVRRPGLQVQSRAGYRRRRPAGGADGTSSRGSARSRHSAGRAEGHTRPIIEESTGRPHEPRQNVRLPSGVKYEETARCAYAQRGTEPL
jgi:hypothetical protein